MLTSTAKDSASTGQASVIHGIGPYADAYRPANQRCLRGVFVASVLGTPVTSDDYRRSHRLLLFLIAAHVILMTLFPWIARFPGAAWDDMLEAWAWGKHFELGYYKHPPLYAWVAGIWLRIFPRTDLCFYLLPALNIGLSREHAQDGKRQRALSRTRLTEQADNFSPPNIEGDSFQDIGRRRLRARKRDTEIPYLKQEFTRGSDCGQVSGRHKVIRLS